MPITKRRPRKPKTDFLKASQNMARFREIEAATASGRRGKAEPVDK